MARSYTGGDADQKDFVKVFDSLTGRYNRWEVWRDMVWMIATSISNAVDKRYSEQREQIYRDIVSKYSENEMERFAELFTMLTDSMDKKVRRGDWGDFMGELFMNLELGNDLGGQFFTPYHVCLMMARVTIDGAEKLSGDIERKGYASCNDPACGAGATLIAAAEVFKEKGIDYQQDIIFVGQDIDSTTALMCYIQLSLLGCSGYVIIGNTLTEPSTGDPLFGEDSERCWYTPMYFADVWQYRRWAAVQVARFREALAAIDGKDEKATEAILSQLSEPEKIPAEEKNTQDPEQIFLLPEMPLTETEMPRKIASKPTRKPRAGTRKKNEVLEGQISITF